MIVQSQFVAHWQMERGDHRGRVHTVIVKKVGKGSTATSAPIMTPAVPWFQKVKVEYAINKA